MSGNVIPVDTMKRSVTSDVVLEIDIDAAWKKLGLSAGWSNEVTVVLYIQ